MTEQEKQHLKDIALVLLIDSKAEWLPINIFPIAKEYNMIHVINNDRSLFDNMVEIAKGILEEYGMNKPGFPEYLSARVLAPLALLYAANVNSPEDVYFLTGLPWREAVDRYESYVRITSDKRFNLFNLENRLVNQFSWWINRRYN